MENEAEIAKLPLLAFAEIESPNGSGMVTPPFHTSVSVPFGWEEEPGKPRFTSSHSNNTQTKCLELPPRLLLMDPKLPPPITAQKGMFHLPNQIGAMVFRKRQLLMEKDWFSWLGKPCFGTKTQAGFATGSVFPSSEERCSTRTKIAVTEKEGSFSTCVVLRKHRRRVGTDQHSVEEKKKHKK